MPLKKFIPDKCSIKNGICNKDCNMFWICGFPANNIELKASYDKLKQEYDLREYNNEFIL